MRMGWLVVMLTAAVGCSGSATGELEVAKVFGDHMVLQREAVVPIWGHAAAGTDVTVTVADRSATAAADGDGKWRVEIGPFAVGGPLEITVTGGGQSLRFGDVMVGDVWVCSGQSNMEWVVENSMDAAAEIAAADDPTIRHFKMPKSWSETPSDRLAGGEWQVADSEHVGQFTAVGYFFARELRPSVDVPIGLLHTSWGGSRIEPWMSAASLGLDDEGLAEVMAEEEAYEKKVLDGLKERLGRLPEAEGDMSDEHAVWADPALDDGEWFEISASSIWEEQEWWDMDGIAWYRAPFDLTADEAAAGIRLGLGTIDDSDISWVNGHEVGRTELAWNKPRVYDVPPDAVVEGRNVIAVRVEDTGGGGGLYGDADSRFVEVGGERRLLPDVWRFRVEKVTFSTEYRKTQVPTVLYNKMIHPLIEYPVAGFLWYQGESNAGGDDAYRYRELFATMIGQWRDDWGQGNLPFLWVQLANFMAPSDEPADSSWAMLRESQSTALALPNTGQAVTIDVGEADDIHPRNKQAVGRRLALAARHVAYGEEIVYSGPVYRSHEVRGRRVVLDFDHLGGGLVAAGREDGHLAEFAIAGEDRLFKWADAVIDGDRVIVWNDRVPRPVAVRYAWADNPEGANLTNAEGLPASPFRTDDW